MVAYVFDVRHGYCSMCGAAETEEAPLFILYLTVGESPRYARRPANVHQGLCDNCIALIQKTEPGKRGQV